MSPGCPGAFARLLGFLPVTATLWLLHGLSSALSSERIAVLQLLLLTGSALAWLCRRRGPSAMASLIIATLLIVSAMVLGSAGTAVPVTGSVTESKEVP